jgi:hypothetical protein
MFSQGNASQRDKKNQYQSEIDPFGILGEDLSWFDLIQRKKQRWGHDLTKG